MIISVQTEVNRNRQMKVKRQNWVGIHVWTFNSKQMKGKCILSLKGIGEM